MGQDIVQPHPGEVASLVARRVQQNVLQLPIHLRHQQRAARVHALGEMRELRVGAAIGVAIDGRPRIPSPPSGVDQRDTGHRVSEPGAAPVAERRRRWPAPIEEVTRQQEDVRVADVVGERERRRDRVGEPRRTRPRASTATTARTAPTAASARPAMPNCCRASHAHICEASPQLTGDDAEHHLLAPVGFRHVEPERGDAIASTRAARRSTTRRR